MVSRLGDCEALVRTAAKECLAKAGEGSHPSPGGSLNPQLWHSQPCRSFFFPSNRMNSISRDLHIPNQNQHGNAAQLAVMWPQVLWGGGWGVYGT